MKVPTKEKFSDYLERQFIQRKQSNPAYSIRAFARFLGVDQSSLAKFLKGERNLPWMTVIQCLQKLSAPKELVESFEEERHNLLSDYEEIADALFIAMSDWKYWAVLEYFKIDPTASEETLSKRFHFEVIEVQDILSRLHLLGFIKKTGDRYKLLKPNNSWVDVNKTSEARKELQRKITKLSSSAIDTFSIDERFHGSLTVAVNKEKLPEIKEKLNAIQLDFGRYLQKKSDLNEVYQLTLSFFPLTVQEQK